MSVIPVEKCLLGCLIDRSVIMTRRKPHTARLLRMFTCAVAAVGLVADVAAESWSMGFASTGVVPAVDIYYPSPPRFAIGADGQVSLYAFREPGRLGAGLARIDVATGAATWSAVNPISDEYTVEPRALALPDGSTILLAERLSRYSPTGELVWSLPSLHIKDVAMLGTGEVLAVTSDSGRINLMRLSAATGATVERVQTDLQASTAMLAAMADTAYVQSSSSFLAQIKLSPLRITWTTASSASSIAADASGVYANSDVLRKYSAADGSVAWQADVAGAISLDPSGHLVTSGNPIKRWDALTGALLWQANESGIARIDAASSAVYFVDTDPPAKPTDGFTGILGRLDLANGATQWRQQTAPTATTRFGDVGFHGDHVVASAVACAAPIDSPCYVKLWMADAASGASFAPVDFITRTGTRGSAKLEEGDRTLAWAIEWGSDGPQLHLRTINNADGIVQHETATPFALSAFPHADLGWMIPPAHEIHVARTTDGNVIAAYSTYGLPPPWYFANATLMKIDAITGAILWQKYFLADVVFSALSAPVVDPSGNVSIGVIDRTGAVPSVPDRRWVRQFSAANGSLLWELEFPVDPFNLGDFHAPAIVSAGNHIGVYDAPIGSAERRFTVLAANDGTTMWSLDSSSDYLGMIDGSRMLSIRYDTRVTWTILDVASGNMLATGQYQDAADASYTLNGGVLPAADGSLYIGARSTLQPATGGQRRILLIRADGSSGQFSWVKRFDENPVSPTARFNPRLASSTRVQGTQPLSATYGFALTTLSAVDGTHLGSTFLYASPYEQPFEPQLGEQGVLGGSASGEMIVIGPRQLPGSPSESVVSNWGMPEPGPIGDLRINLGISPTSFGDWIDYPFVFETRNDGNVTAGSVKAMLSLPSDSIVSALTCELGGAPCIAKTSATSVDGTFTIPAGAVLRISGSARLPAGNAPHLPYRFNAYAFAPFPFTEMNLVDNQTAYSSADRIFRSGFEALSTP